MLKVKDFCLEYDNNEILHNINFSLEKGKILGLIGPSGVGKTSLIKSLVGIYKGNSGSITYNNEDIYDNVKVKKHIAYVPDEQSGFYLITLKNIIEFYKAAYENFNYEKFYKINKIFKIPLNKRFLQLSKGMKMRVSLMVALSLDCELLVLDEPLSGLDPILKNKVLQIIKNEVEDKNKSVIISSHNLIELERFCDDILIINNGKVEYSNSLKGIKENFKRYQIAFDMPVYKEDLYFPGIININQVGRVFTIEMDGKFNEFKSYIEKYKPLFIEEINLNLEEIFISKIEGNDKNEKIF